MSKFHTPSTTVEKIAYPIDSPYSSFFGTSLPVSVSAAVEFSVVLIAFSESTWLGEGFRAAGEVDDAFLRLPKHMMQRIVF